MNAEHLLTHGTFLRALARRLVRDAARADDAVQDAWLAALRERHGVRAPRAWLAGVVRHVTRRQARSERRRRKREEAVATERGSSTRATLDVVAQEEARRRVVQAVLALDEPYRTTILLRYYDGLRPKEIAGRTGITASAVRTRLQRGLALLRARLDAQGRDWARALVPFAAAAPAGAGLAAAAAVVAAAILVGTTVWIGAGSRTDRMRRTDARREPGTAMSAATARGHEPDRASLPARVRERNDGDDRRAGETAARRATATDRNAQAPDEDLNDPWKEPAYPDDTLIAVFRVVDGRVEDQAHTNSRSNAAGEPGLPGVNAGRFLVVVAGKDHVPVVAVRDTVARPYEGHHVPLPDVQLQTAQSIEGRIVDSAGRPIPDVEVRARLTRRSGRILDVSGRNERFLYDGQRAIVYEKGAHTRADGTYRIGGLSEDVYEVWCERHGGAHGSVTYDGDALRYTARVRAPGRGHDFRIARARLALSLRGDDGEPLHGATVRIGHPGGEERHDQCAPEFSLYYFPGAPQRFTVERTGYEPVVREIAAPADGRSQTVPIELRRRLDPGTLRVTIAAPKAAGALPDRYGFRLTPLDARPDDRNSVIRRTAARRENAYVLNDLPAARYRLEARGTGWVLPEGGYLEDLATEIVIEPGRVREITLRPRAAGRLHLAVRTPGGTSKVPATVTTTGPAGDERTLRFVKGGPGGYVTLKNKLAERPGTARVAEALLPGLYRVHVETRDGETATAEARIEAGRTTRVEIVIGAP